MSTITSQSPNNGTPAPTPPSATPPSKHEMRNLNRSPNFGTPASTPSSATPLSKKQQNIAQNTIGLYAVQCSECYKWRLIPDEEEYETIRSKTAVDPFVCSKKPNVSCNDDADIQYDASRTWVMDKPNIPRTPTGFKRKLVLRRDFSKLDAYYVTPSGKKVRSITEVSKYLDENKENKDIKDVSVSEFSFAVPKVAEDTIPKSFERKTPNSKGEKKAKEPREPATV